MSHRPPLILASASPRRRELLGSLGLDFTVRPVDLEETPHPNEEPRAYVERLAREKARARCAPGELVLAADTIVVADGELLGKPSGPEEAEAMLHRLAGREHTVLTGVALRQPGTGEQAPEEPTDGAREEATVERSDVTLAPLSSEEIRWYVTTGEPLDKAGSYAIQGLGALFVESVRGNYSNVVGLPLPALYRLFRRLGHDLLDFRASAPER